MLSKQSIKKRLKQSIAKNYGQSEADNPCYDLDILADAVLNEYLYDELKDINK